MLQGVYNKRLIFVIALFLIVALSVFTTSLFIRPNLATVQAQSHPKTPSVEQIQTILPQQTTGLRQYASAKEAALAWATDAQLVLATAQWPRLTHYDQLQTPNSWSYHFYSATKARKLFVIVSPDHQIETIQHAVEVTLPPQTINTDQWLIDSPVILGLWLDKTGYELFRDSPEVELALQLRPVGSTTDPGWLVVGLDKRTNQTRSLIIEAVHGQLINN